MRVSWGKRTGDSTACCDRPRHRESLDRSGSEGLPLGASGPGLFGNTLFVIGSVMFFRESAKTLAIWLFVLGSLGMLLGSIGELLVRVEKQRRGDD
ncbi:MAG: YrhK family protein [Nocardioidaceae bacterium]